MKLFTVAAAAEMLGVKEKTLRDWIWKKKIETVRKGSRYVRISEETLKNFVVAHTVPVDGVTQERIKVRSATTSEVLEARGG
jgi:excisionase family DNA binding protein